MAIDMGSEFGYQLLSGATGYVHDAPLPIATIRVPFGQLDHEIHHYEADAVLCTVRSPKDARIAARLADQMPVVNATGVRCPEEVVNVIGDDHAVGRMAAEHFLDRGLRHFGFSGIPRQAFSDHRCEGFRSALAECGCECQAEPEDCWNLELSWSERLQVHAQWLTSLGRPAGVLAAGDWFGQEITEAARLAKLHVPDDLAVLGVGNEMSVCDPCDPPLSSVDNAPHLRGREAMQVIVDLLSGSPRPTEPIRVPPISVVTRRSTQMLAVEDPELGRALAYIRHHATEGIEVDDIMETLSISRRTLESRFRKSLGRTPGQEIWRVRLEEAKQLLLRSDLGILDIALRCGFNSHAGFCNTFRRHEGVAPNEYRKTRRANLPHGSGSRGIDRL